MARFLRTSCGSSLGISGWCVVVLELSVKVMMVFRLRSDQLVEVGLSMYEIRDRNMKANSLGQLFCVYPKTICSLRSRAKSSHAGILNHLNKKK